MGLDLFKSTTIVVSLYIYFVDNSFYSVITRNNIDFLISLLKYLRLKTVSKVDFDNYYLTTLEVADLALLTTS